jgi:carbonic anhydrase
MNCESSNSPIDITDKSSGNCDLKCKFLFKYTDSSSTITNKGNYLSLSYDKQNTDPVVYNSTPHYVEEVRIYTPSLHTYNGSNADAELIIIHTNDYNTKLLVCIPIIPSEQASVLEFIIETASKFAKKSGQNTFMSKPMNLNNFIPLKKMYVYRGNLPFSPCNGDNNIIVFNKNENTYLSISKQSLNLLNNIITKNVIKQKENTYFVNTKGPLSLSTSDGGEIYIDCKPVSDDGKAIDDEDENEIKSPLSDMFSKINYKSIVNSIIFQIIMSIIGAYIIYKFFFFVMSRFKSGESDVKVPIQLPSLKTLRSKLPSVKKKTE